MPVPGLILLVLAAACQLLIVYPCVRQLLKPLAVWLNGCHADAGLPGTIAWVLQAALFNCGLFLLAVPDLLKGEVSNGLLFLAGTGFAFVGVSSFVTSAVTKTTFATLQLGVSAVGLLCLFLPYFLWGPA